MKKLPLASARDVRAWIKATARSNGREFAVMIGLLCLATVVGLAGPQILGMLVDSVVGGTSTGRIDLLASAFVVLLLVQAALKRMARFRARVLGERVLAGAREEFVGNALTLPLGTVEAAGTGDLLSRATTDVGRIDHAVRFAAPEILVAVIIVLLTLVAMVMTSPLLRYMSRMAAGLHRSPPGSARRSRLAPIVRAGRVCPDTSHRSTQHRQGGCHRLQG